MRRTPISGRADRADERVRLIEETVLLIRGEWPAAASGLCESVNRATGVFAPASERSVAIDEAAEEATRLVERLYGDDALLEVRRLSALDREPGESGHPDHDTARRRRVHLPSRSRRRVRARAGW